VTVAGDGVHTLTFWSVDLAGNVELEKTVQILIDQTAPTITHTLSPFSNVAGWNKSDVTVNFMCGDSLSGIAFCTPPQTVSTEGQSQQVTGTALDNAGNQAQDTVRRTRTAGSTRTCSSASAALMLCPALLPARHRSRSARAQISLLRGVRPTLLATARPRA
jgi:hypothetical protein